MASHSNRNCLIEKMILIDITTLSGTYINTIFTQPNLTRPVGTAPVRKKISILFRFYSKNFICIIYSMSFLHLSMLLDVVKMCAEIVKFRNHPFKL
jgi:hypothetical protein